MDLALIFHPTNTKYEHSEALYKDYFFSEITKTQQQQQQQVQDVLLSPPVTPKVRAQTPLLSWTFNNNDTSKLLESPPTVFASTGNSRRKSRACLYRRKDSIPNTQSAEEHDITFTLPSLLPVLSQSHCDSYIPHSFPRTKTNLYRTQGNGEPMTKRSCYGRCPLPETYVPDTFTMNLSELYQISPLQKEIPVFQPCQYYPQDTPSPGTSEGSNDFRILQDTSDTAIDFTSDFKSKSSKNHSPDRKPERYLRKKSKTDAAIVYDQVDINADEAGIYDIEWIPHMEVFNRKSHIRVTWKGSPSNISDLPFYEKLHPGEVHIASTLRLTPEQYLRCKRVLILGAQEASKKNSSFRKSDAQRVCRIDVNKASTLWSVFGRLGWLGPKWPH